MHHLFDGANAGPVDYSDKFQQSPALFMLRIQKYLRFVRLA